MASDKHSVFFYKILVKSPSGLYRVMIQFPFPFFRGFIQPSLIKKKIKFSYILYKEIQKGAVAKSCMTKGLLIYGEIFAHFLIF